MLVMSSDFDLTHLSAEYHDVHTFCDKPFVTVLLIVFRTNVTAYPSVTAPVFGRFTELPLAISLVRRITATYEELHSLIYLYVLPHVWEPFYRPRFYSHSLIIT